MSTVPPIGKDDPEQLVAILVDLDAVNSYYLILSRNTTNPMSDVLIPLTERINTMYRCFLRTPSPVVDIPYRLQELIQVFSNDDHIVFDPTTFTAEFAALCQRLLTVETVTSVTLTRGGPTSDTPAGPVVADWSPSEVTHSEYAPCTDWHPFTRLTTVYIDSMTLEEWAVRTQQFPGRSLFLEVLRDAPGLENVILTEAKPGNQSVTETVVTMLQRRTRGSIVRGLYSVHWGEPLAEYLRWHYTTQT